MSTQTPPEPSAQSRQESNPENNSHFAGACSKCAHHKTCKTPCFFVKQYLNFENKQPFEVDWNINPPMRVMAHGNRREIREASMPDFDSGKPTGLKQKVFSDQHPSPFVDAINTDLKQTGVFIDRFFYRMSFKDLAEKYEMTEPSASTLYRKAQNRILELIGAEKRRKIASANCEQIVMMPKAIQCFLLYSVFGLTCPEVSSILNVGQSYVHREIKKIRDQIICGEITMLEFIQSDREAAGERLEKFRKKKQKQDKAYHEKNTRKACKGAQA